MSFSVRQALLIAGFVALGLFGPELLNSWFGIAPRTSTRIVVWLIVGSLLVGLIYFVWKWETSVPKCKNNKCGPRRFTCQGLARAKGLELDGLLWECSCGDSYIQIENRFLMLNGRELVKYKTKRPWIGTWVDDL